MQQITTFLTFEKDGKAAIELYTSVFKDSAIDNLMTLPDSGQLLHGSFRLNGQSFMAMDGGEHFQFSDGVSLFVHCEDQAEVDYYWQALTVDGGRPGRCGWLKDRFGMSWQVVPKQLGELMQQSDPTAATRVRDALMQMDKIEIARLQQAADSN